MHSTTKKKAQEGKRWELTVLKVIEKKENAGHP
jgi:hypothetical protein